MNSITTTNNSRINNEEENREKGIYRITIKGTVANFLLVLLKFLAGIFGQSAAMLADAIHSLSDFITDIIVLIFVHLSNKPEDKGHDYGHGKFETLATTIIGIFLFCAGTGIMWNGGSTIWEVIQGATIDSPGTFALIAALISIAVKEILYRYTLSGGKKYNSQAVIANAWHHRSDAFSSIGTSIGIGGAIFLGEKWRILDPIAAVIVSVFIIKTAIELVMPCLDELLEKSLPESMENRIKETILSFPGVSDPHNLRTRRIGNYSAVDVHIRMNGDITLREAHDVTTKIEQKMKHLLGNGTYVCIHVEPEKTAH